MSKFIKFSMVLFAAITLSAAMAHLLALPAKMALPKEEYFMVQGIYKGWAWLGIFEIGAIVLTLVWLMREHKLRRQATYLVIALTCFGVSMAVFFLFTFPANQVTLRWTKVSKDWKVLRAYWEYSHAARAILYLGGFSFLIFALLQSRVSLPKSWEV